MANLLDFTTPGTWRLKGKLIMSDDTVIATITEGADEREQIANAHLIMMAPKLYKSIQDLLDKCMSGKPVREPTLRELSELFISLS